VTSSADVLGPQDIRTSIPDHVPDPADVGVIEPMPIAAVTGRKAVPRPMQPPHVDAAKPTIPQAPTVPDLAPLFGPPIPGGPPKPVPNPKSTASKLLAPRPAGRTSSAIGDREPSAPIALTKPLSKRPRPLDIDIDEPATMRRPSPRGSMASIHELTLDDTIDPKSDRETDRVPSRPPPSQAAPSSHPLSSVEVPPPPPEIMAMSERAPLVDDLPPPREQDLSDPFLLLRPTRPPPPKPEAPIIPNDVEPAPSSAMSADPIEPLEDLPPIGDVLPAAAEPSPNLADLPPMSEEPPTMRVVDELAARLPMLGRAALLSDDDDAFLAWKREVSENESRSRLIERVRAMAALRRDDPTEAVRALRVACEQAQGLGPIERCRSHLAYAVGLARIGRPLDSLVEALEALARAREARDASGEKASVLFLFKLYEQSGHERAAQAWARIGGQAAS
jgi:hypothetical protein